MKFTVGIISYILYMFSCMIKGLESSKGQNPHQRKLISPTDNTAPEIPHQ